MAKDKKNCSIKFILIATQSAINRKNLSRKDHDPCQLSGERRWVKSIRVKSAILDGRHPPPPSRRNWKFPSISDTGNHLDEEIISPTLRSFPSVFLGEFSFRFIYRELSVLNLQCQDWKNSILREKRMCFYRSHYYSV